MKRKMFPLLSQSSSTSADAAGHFASSSIASWSDAMNLSKRSCRLTGRGLRQAPTARCHPCGTASFRRLPCSDIGPLRSGARLSRASPCTWAGRRRRTRLGSAPPSAGPCRRWILRVLPALGAPACHSGRPLAEKPATPAKPKASLFAGASPWRPDRSFPARLLHPSTVAKHKSPFHAAQSTPDIAQPAALRRLS